jgi:hypothetical protein
MLLNALGQTIANTRQQTQLGTSGAVEIETRPRRLRRALDRLGPFQRPAAEHEEQGSRQHQDKSQLG